MLEPENRRIDLPHEAQIERTGHLPMDLVAEVQKKAMAAGLYAANMPEEVGGAGLGAALDSRARDDK